MMRHRNQEFKSKPFAGFVAKEVAEHHRVKVELDLMLGLLPEALLES
jgi:hypothetical protein